jgi:hypothetical protein
MTTVNVTHVKGCAEDLELGEGTVQQIRNGRIVSLTKLGASSIPWSLDPVTGALISIRAHIEGLEAELAASVAEAKYWADRALAIINDSTNTSTNGSASIIDDNSSSLVKTWSSSKLSAALDTLIELKTQVDTSLATTEFVIEADSLKVDKDSDTGAALIPSGTTAQRPVGGQSKLRFNTDIGRFEGHNGNDWGLLGGALGGGKDAIFYTNDQTVTEDFTINTGQNAMSVGPTINFVPSAVVTVETGASWTVI